METICNYSKSSRGGIITRVSLEGQGLLGKEVGKPSCGEAPPGEPSRGWP